MYGIDQLTSSDPSLLPQLLGNACTTLFVLRSKSTSRLGVGASIKGPLSNMSPVLTSNDLALDLGCVVLLAWVSEGWRDACSRKGGELGDLDHCSESGCTVEVLLVLCLARRTEEEEMIYRTLHLPRPHRLPQGRTVQRTCATQVEDWPSFQ